MCFVGNVVYVYVFKIIYKWHDDKFGDYRWSLSWLGQKVKDRQALYWTQPNPLFSGLNHFQVFLSCSY